MDREAKILKLTEKTGITRINDNAIRFHLSPIPNFYSMLNGAKIRCPICETEESETQIWFKNLEQVGITCPEALAAARVELVTNPKIESDLDHRKISLKCPQCELIHVYENWD